MVRHCSICKDKSYFIERDVTFCTLSTLRFNDFPSRYKSLTDCYDTHENENCNICRQKTDINCQNVYIFPADTLYVLLRFYTYGYDNVKDKFYKYHTLINNFNVNDFFIPNMQNKTFKVISAIIHIGEFNNGHYYLITRQNNKWIKINDQYSHETVFPENLSDVFALFLVIN